MSIFLIISVVFFSLGCLCLSLDIWFDKIFIRGAGWIFLAIALPLMIVGLLMNEHDKGKNLVDLSKKTAVLQSEEWKKNDAYLDSELALQKRDSSFDDWFIGKKLTKSKIEVEGNSVAFEYGIRNSYLRVIMTDGRVSNINCKNINSTCPSLREMNKVIG